MRVLFLQDNGINESLALTELSAYLKAHGHQTGLFLEKEEKHLESKVRDFAADLFLVPCSILAHHWALRMASWLKARFDRKVVFAGTHPTFFPDIIHEEPVDVLCIGEAEGAVLELCDKLERGEDIRGIENLWVKEDGRVHKNPLRPLLHDLDALPLPDRELYYHYGFMRTFQWRKFMSGRGCYHNCSYCYQPAFRRMYRNKGTYVRRKSPRRVLDEICAMQARYPIRIAHFSDDLFITDTDWVEAFAEEKVRRTDLPFSCNSSVEFVNERTVRALKKAGCRYVAIGIETGNEEERTRILNKKIKNEEIRHAARLIKDAGIRLVTFNMIAGPGETVHQAMETLRLNRQIRADQTRVTLCAPIPGTRLVQESVERGYLDPSFGSRDADFPDVADGDPLPRFKTLREREFRNLYHLFNWAVLLPAAAEPLLERLLRLPPNPLFRLAGLLRIYMEKRVSGLTLWNGLTYYRHVGDPAKQTTNFVILV